MVAVGAVEDKKPTVVFNVDWCVAVVIAGRPERRECKSRYRADGTEYSRGRSDRILSQEKIIEKTIEKTEKESKITD